MSSSSRACPDAERQRALRTLGRLVNTGAVSLDGKKHLREIAGALVRLSLPKRGMPTLRCAASSAPGDSVFLPRSGG